MRRRNYSHNAPIEAANRELIYGEGGYIHGQRGPVIRDMRYGIAKMGGTACELIAIYNALNKLGIRDGISKLPKMSIITSKIVVFPQPLSPKRIIAELVLVSGKVNSILFSP